ncbi:hypothetical protein ACP8HI_17825 [Paenibacillus sp. FA6]|uniref:hypothetical protein n=1 Tax=Paenibacillus sp. FA6 TaxID=3413029 RepID=UPI003F65D76E
MGNMYSSDIEGITERVVEDALSSFLGRAIDLIFAHIGWILLAIAILCVIALISILMRIFRNMKKKLKYIKQLMNDKSVELNRLILSEVIQDVQKGLVEGKTKSELEKLEREMLLSHHEVDQIQNRLNECEINYFALMASSHTVDVLEDDVIALAEQIDAHMTAMETIKSITKTSTSFVESVQLRYTEISEKIEGLKESSRYLLENLLHHQEQAEQLVQKFVQSSRFDGMKSQKEIGKISMELDTLLQRTLRLERNINVFQEMKKRITDHTEDLLSRETSQLEHDQRRNKVEEMMGKVESQLRLGEDVDLRTVATDIDNILDGL